MTSADRLSLVLRRLDEIERKLDRIMEELRPTAIGYSAQRGNRPRKDQGHRPGPTIRTNNFWKMV